VDVGMRVYAGLGLRGVRVGRGGCGSSGDILLLLLLLLGLQLTVGCA
jgi:hypothetical protein